MKTPKKWLLVPMAAAMLAVGTIGSMSVFAATEPPAVAAAEAAETNAPETTEANDPQLPGGGHADAEGADANTQFDGVQ